MDVLRWPQDSDRGCQTTQQPGLLLPRLRQRLSHQSPGCTTRLLQCACPSANHNPQKKETTQRTQHLPLKQTNASSPTCYNVLVLQPLHNLGHVALQQVSVPQLALLLIQTRALNNGKTFDAIILVGEQQVSVAQLALLLARAHRHRHSTGSGARAGV